MIELRKTGVICLLVVASCSSTEGDGGMSGAANGGGAAGASSGASGSSGEGGTAPGGGGSNPGGGSGNTTTGGATTGGASGASGASGAATGGGATGGMPTGGTGGAGAGAGMAGGGTAGTSVGGAGSGDSYVSGVNVAVHPEVNTILVVTWNQLMAADDTHLEFTFENGNILRSRAKPGATGMHRDVTLGVPGSTPVTIRIVSRVGTASYPTRDYMGTTGAVPSGVPVPTVMMYDAMRASPEQYMFGGVENSNVTAQCTGASMASGCYNRATFYSYIMDRRGRIVWYYSDPDSDATSSFQRVARDGEYIWIEKRAYIGAGMRRGVLKMTLDHEYFEEIPISDLADSIDVTTDGGLIYNSQGSNWQLKERTRAGMVRNIWSCPTAFGSSFACYTNAVNWSERDNTIFMSFPDENTIAEVRRDNGMLVATYGDRAGGYTLPSGFSFEFQHFPNISADGTLMVSSHVPGHSSTYTPLAGGHQFQEFRIDRTARTLTQVWMYNAGQEWAMYKGMAVKLANGNVIANYGSGGVIREITQDKTTVFYVKFDDPDGNDFYNKFVGNNVFVADLYALNGGGPTM
jgi:hypothetical protein